MRRFLVLPIILVSACSVASSQPPQLVSEITLAPGTKGALVTPTDTPTTTPTPVTPTDTPTTTPTPSDTPVEPTLPPSLTPRPTRTDTPLPSATFTPTRTEVPTRTPRPTRTPLFTATPVTPTPLPCDTRWFFTPRPYNCPMSAYELGPSVYQQFEHGFMVWFGADHVIFAVFQSTGKTRWGQYTDTWTADMPDSDPSLVPPEGLLQPVRGFGLVWRSARGVQQRLGWASSPEVSYEGALQVDILGNRYLRGPHGEVYQLNADLTNWQMIAPGR